MATKKRAAGGPALDPSLLAKKAKTQQEQDASSILASEPYVVIDDEAEGLNVSTEETKVAEGNPNNLPLERIPHLIGRELLKSDAQKVEKALGELADLCDIGIDRSRDEAKNNRELVFICGGHLSLWRTLVEFPDVLGIQEKGCAAIMNVFYGAHVSRKNCAGPLRMVETLVNIMRKFPESAMLQDNATGAIDNLLISCRENAEHFVNGQGIETLVVAMKKFPESVETQEWGCSIIFHCIKVLEDKSPSQFIGNKAMAYVRAAQKNHHRNKKVREMASKAQDAYFDAVLLRNEMNNR